MTWAIILSIPLAAFALRGVLCMVRLARQSARAVGGLQMSVHPCPSSGPERRWRSGGHRVMGGAGQRWGAVRRR